MIKNRIESHIAAVAAVPSLIRNSYNTLRKRLVILLRFCNRAGAFSLYSIMFFYSRYPPDDQKDRERRIKQGSCAFRGVSSTINREMIADFSVRANQHGSTEIIPKLY